MRRPPRFRNPHVKPVQSGAYDYVPAASKIPDLYSQEDVADPLVHIKLFNPTGSWTWYLTEFRDAERLAFGLVHGHEIELGYVSLDELAKVQGGFGLRIERDCHWTPTPLSEVRKRLEVQHVDY